MLSDLTEIFCESPRHFQELLRNHNSVTVSMDRGAFAGLAAGRQLRPPNPLDGHSQGTNCDALSGRLKKR